jgi:hypothetical protein
VKVVVKPRPAAGSDKIDVDWAVVDVDWPVARTDWPIGPVDDYVVVVADVDRRPSAADVDGRSIAATDARPFRKAWAAIGPIAAADAGPVLKAGSIGPIPTADIDRRPVPTTADARPIRKIGSIGPVPAADARPVRKIGSIAAANVEGRAVPVAPTAKPVPKAGAVGTVASSNAGRSISTPDGGPAATASSVRP